MKIEFDIPEFKRELKIEITIRRDGEVVYSASSSSAGEDSAIEQKPITKSPASKPTEKKPAKSSGGGNMMNMEF